MQEGGGAGGSLALLGNFKLPLPGKVTAARPSAVLAWFASPPRRMDIISRGLWRRQLRFAPCECGLQKMAFVSRFLRTWCGELVAPKSLANPAGPSQPLQPFLIREC